MLLQLCVICTARDPSRNLYVDPHGDGDCFGTPCSIQTAALVARCADVIHFPPAVIKPTSYPSDFSDLFLQMSLMNVTAVSDGTVIDGRYLSGEMLMQITSHEVFTWVVFDNFTFKHFTKPIATRQYTWSAGPYVMFRNCIFEDSDSDLFVVKGGTLIFENCIFRNVKGRPIKGIGEVTTDFTDCVFEECGSLFFSECGASFTNCRFKQMRGKRGGAIYAAKTTLNIERCMFVDCHAEFSGGAIYIRDAHERLESEIKDSCFVRTAADVNGSAVYCYCAYVELSGNCFASEKSIVNVSGSVEVTNSTYDATCRAWEAWGPAQPIPIDYTPTDTNKWYQFDDMRSGATIIIDDDEL